MNKNPPARTGFALSPDGQRPAPSRRPSSAKAVGPRAATRTSPHAVSQTSARGSWEETCSARFAEQGRTLRGRARGVRAHRSTCRSSFSRITLGSPSRWTVAQTCAGPSPTFRTVSTGSESRLVALRFVGIRPITCSAAKQQESHVPKCATILSRQTSVGRLDEMVLWGHH